MGDLLVGLVTIPLYITLQYVHVYDNFEDEIIIVAVANFMDMFTGFTSIFTRATIALERMYAVGWPFRHRTHSSWFSILVISVPWILSLVAASTKIVLQYVLVRPLTFIFILIVSMFTPIIITCTACFFLWIKERSRVSVLRGDHHHRQLQKRRLAKTVALITGLFLITWLPFQISLVVMSGSITRSVACYETSPVWKLSSQCRYISFERQRLQRIFCRYDFFIQRPSPKWSTPAVTLTTFADFNANTSVSFRQTHEISAMESQGITTPQWRQYGIV